MKHTKKTLLAATLTLFAVGMISPAASQATQQVNSTDNSTVTVQVAEKTAIDISPDTLAYNSVDPGSTQFGTNNEGDGENFTHVELENIGSTNISRVWMNSSTPDSRPFGSGVASNYDAGNFIQIKPQDGLTNVGAVNYNSWTFVTREEFSTDNVPEYIFTPGDAWEVGRFRLADQEYFWAMEQASTDGSTCAANADSFRVGNLAHNKTDTGSNDFRDSSTEYTAYGIGSGASNATANGEIVATDVNVSGRNYRMKIDCNPASASGNVAVTRSRFNTELGYEDLTDIETGAAEYLLNASVGTENALQPGEHFSVQTRVSVPLGSAQGQADNGFLRVLVNTY